MSGAVDVARVTRKYRWNALLHHAVPQRPTAQVVAAVAITDARGLDRPSSLLPERLCPLAVEEHLWGAAHLAAGTKAAAPDPS